MALSRGYIGPNKTYGPRKTQRSRYRSCPKKLKGLLRQGSLGITHFIFIIRPYSRGFNVKKSNLIPMSSLFTESSIFVGILTLLLGLISFRFLFFSFYISSEKTIDAISLFLLKNFYKFKNRKLKSV